VATDVTRAVTSQEGLGSIPALPPGTYKLAIEPMGFRRTSLRKYLPFNRGDGERCLVREWAVENLSAEWLFSGLRQPWHSLGT